MRSRIVIACLASIGATVAFMVACGTGPTGASAQSSCAQWVVTQFDLQDECAGAVPLNASGRTCTLPAGWQPIGVSNNSYDHIILGRCAP